MSFLVVGETKYKISSLKGKTEKEVRHLFQGDHLSNPYSEKRMENLLKALKDNKVLSTPKKKKEEPKEEGE